MRALPLLAGTANNVRGGATAPSVVLLGAHCDDLEIGAGATLLQLARAWTGLVVDATVLTSTPQRAAETRAALHEFLPGANLRLEAYELPDGRLPLVWNEVKQLVEDVRTRVPDPDLVLAPWSGDAHQDHRLLAEIVPTVFRDHLVLHYEILKWDGDLGRPTTYVAVPDDLAERKWTLLHQHYVSQRQRTWFDREAVLGLMRVRGVECHQRYAEAFYVRKLVFDPTGGRS